MAPSNNKKIIYFFAAQVLFLILFFTVSQLSFAQKDSSHHSPLIKSFNPYIDLGIDEKPLSDNLSYIRYIRNCEGYRSKFLEAGSNADYTGFYYQQIALRYSYISDYDIISGFMDSAQPGVLTLERNTADHIFKNGPPALTSFSDFLKNIQDTVRAVFINESHQIAKHRILTTLLLQPLYDKGFRYLFLESLSQNDTVLSERKAPLITTGGYVVEPLLADLIREALRIGFKVLPLQQRDTTMKILTVNTRDSLMAASIARIYKDDPDAKVLVHAGWAHIQENSNVSWNTMGNFYRLMTNINPLTIDQTLIIEANSIYTDSETIYNDNVKEMSIMENGFNKNTYDMTSLFPKTNYINHRPDWLKMNGYRKAFPLTAEMYSKLQDSSLVQAFYKNEYEKYGALAIPVDQMYIISPDKNYSFFLPVGEFIIRAINNDEEILGLWNVKNPN